MNSAAVTHETVARRISVYFAGNTPQRYKEL